MLKMFKSSMLKLVWENVEICGLTILHVPQDVEMLECWKIEHVHFLIKNASKERDTVSTIQHCSPSHYFNNSTFSTLQRWRFQM